MYCAYRLKSQYTYCNFITFQLVCQFFKELVRFFLTNCFIRRICTTITFSSFCSRRTLTGYDHRQFHRLVISELVPPTGYF